MEKSRLIKRICAALFMSLAVIAVIAGVALCAVFPNKYASEINSAADEFGVSRALVRSVVWAESKFDARATSDKGAVGLMQLMPETFDDCAAALRIKNADIYNRADNLRCGCYYLSLLIDKFDGDERAAIMAYNAGEANAKKFLTGAEIFPETRKYVKSVSAARKVYGIFDRTE